MAFATEQTADRATSTNAATTSHTVSLPNNIASGDLILVTGSLDTATGGIMTVPAGWTELIDEAPMVALYRVADGSEGASITVDTSESVDSSWVARRITGHNSAVESAINPSDGSDTNNANPDPPSLSPSWGADDTLWVAAFGCRVSDRALNSYPTDYVEGDTAQTGNTRSASATRDLNATSEDPGTFGLSSNTPWIAATIAVEPGGINSATISEGAGTDDQNAVVSADDVDPNADHHDLERSLTGAGSWSVVKDDLTLADGDTIVDATVDPDTNYDYRLVSYELADETGSSATSNTQTILTAPARPVALRTAPRNLVTAEGADPRMDTDTDGNGIVDGFGPTNTSGTSNADAFSVDASRQAQQLDIVSEDGGSEVGVNVPRTAVTPGKKYTVSVDCEFLGTGPYLKGAILFIWRDSTGTTISTPGPTDFTHTTMQRKEHTETAPSDAATLDVRLEIFTTGDASAESGTGWFRRVLVYLDDGSEIAATSFRAIGMDATSGDHHNRLRIREQGQTQWHIDRILDPGEEFRHLFQDLTSGATYEWVGSAYNASQDLESGLTSVVTTALSGKPDTPEVFIDAVGGTSADLSSSAFSDPQGDAHAASEWEVDEQAGDFSTPVFDSGEDTSNLTSITATGLSTGTDYKARVRHKDDQGNWSSWSTAKNFSTLTNEPPDRPSLTVTSVAQTTADLSGSGYSDPEGDAHQASQWQVDEDGGDWSTPVFDSGTDTTNLESITATGLTAGTAYQARVRYQDANLQWSAWSVVETFATQATGVTVQVGTPTRPQDILLGYDFEQGKEGVYTGDPTLNRGSRKYVRSQKAGGRPLYVPVRGDQVGYSRVEVEGVLAPTRALDLGPTVTPISDDSVAFDPSSTVWQETNVGTSEDVSGIFGGLDVSGRRFTWDGAGASAQLKNNSAGTFTGSDETSLAWFEEDSSDEVQIILRDQTAGSNIASATYTFSDDSLSVTGTGFTGTSTTVADRGPNGGRVVRLTLTGSGTAGNNRDLWIVNNPANQGSAAIVHCAFHIERAHPVGPIVYTGAAVTKSSDDFSVPRLTPQAHVGYTRFVQGTAAEGTNRVVWSNGSGTTNKIRLAEDTTAGTFDVQTRDGSSNLANPTLTLNPNAGQLVELVVVYTQSTGETRLAGRVDKGSASSAGDTPASWTPPNQWAKDRHYGADPDGTNPNRLLMLRDVVVEKASVDAALDGTEDDALLDELASLDVPSYGVPR